MNLYCHPVRPIRKVLIALHEKLGPLHARDPRLRPPPPERAALAALAALNPFAKLPVLVLDDGWKIPEFTGLDWKNVVAYANRAFERPSVLEVHKELAPYLAKAVAA